MGSELEPCPFCGEIEEEIVDATRVLGAWRLIHRCRAVGPLELGSSDRSRVVTTWNRRPIESALRARVAELESKLAESEDWKNSLANDVIRTSHENMELQAKLAAATKRAGEEDRGL